MHPNKKFKTDPSIAPDPFGDDEDWDDDDLLQLVADEVPTFSQISQAVKATPIASKKGHKRVDSSTLSGAAKPRTFVFKRPSSTAGSLVSTKPNSYTANVSRQEPVAVDTGSSQLELRSTQLEVRSSQLEVRSSQLEVRSSQLEVSRAQAPCTSATNGSVGQQVKDEAVDVSTLKMQVTDLVRKQHAHEGEIKWLRTTLKERDGQIDAVRTTLNAETAKHRLQTSEKVRGYVKDIESLRSELQFKESELINVTQALDRIKRGKDKPPQPVMKLGTDGFPTTSGFHNTPTRPTLNCVIKTVKVEPMDTVDHTEAPEQGTSDPKCDLAPLIGNRLVPRKLSAGEFQRKLLVSGLLKSKIEEIQRNIENAGVSAISNEELGDRQSCMRLLSESIQCTKDLCYM